MGTNGRSWSKNCPSAGAARPAESLIAKVGVDFVNNRVASPADSPSAFHSMAMMRRALEPLSPPTEVMPSASAPGYFAPMTAVTHSGVTASPCQGTSPTVDARGLVRLSQTEETAERDREDMASDSNSITSCKPHILGIDTLGALKVGWGMLARYGALSRLGNDTAPYQTDGTGG